ncbi:MAG: hypothetical protein KKG06_04135 [Bacteroidetes bacterium]|nr:hypothetical protein [Bacteroidota bacterium]
MRFLTKILILTSLLSSTSLFAQRAKLDWKLHEIGAVKQLITNMGSLWRSNTNYPGLIYCEYPRNSHEEHIGEGGIWVGGIVGNDTSVSVTTGWAPSFEFYPSAEAWDTIWVVNKNDTVDIPYWQKYVGVSDQDFICRYNDYNIRNIPAHIPLFLDVIQTSYSWGSTPLDEMIVYKFYVISRKYNLKDVYIAYWLDGNVGYRSDGWDFALDDYSVYYPDRKLGLSIDYPGGIDGQAVSPIGVKVYPPNNFRSDLLKWTFNWYPGQGRGSPSGQDPIRYLEMSSGKIMENQVDPIGSQFIISFGPFNLNAGDTVSFYVGEILGKGLEGVLKNADRLDWLIGQNFRVPSPPPVPPLRTGTKNHQVILRWNSLEGDVNPENYFDPYRADSSLKPFEGYRIYKSTKSAAGPWTLLAEYDLPDNKYRSNTGLQHEYIDRGLLNNFDYYYSVTAFSKPDSGSDFPSQESSIYKNAKILVPGPEPPPTVGQVAVVPNPYRGDISYHTYDPQWEKPAGTRDRWMEQDRRIQFINIPERCEIKIFTLVGDLVKTIWHDHPSKGYEDWNLTSSVGQAVSSGIYLFTVEDKQNGKVQVGKFVIIK